MNAQKRSRFVRPPRQRALAKLVLVAAEGAVTERQYIEVIKSRFQKERLQRGLGNPEVRVHVIRHGDRSAPNRLLEVLRDEIKSNDQDDNYSAWLICDRDQWTPEQFQKVQEWVDKDSKRNRWVLNAPNFEYWLSLHFKNSDEWRRYSKRYAKRIQPSDFSYEQIISAAKKARLKFQNVPDLLEHDGSQMFQFVEYLAREYGLEKDFI